MKKLLLSFAAFAALAASANAQTQRMSLYEEFTGEDCAPCAYANPLLWNLMGLPGNDGAKVQMLSFQEPIPHKGFIYFHSQATSDARLTYYSVNGTPTGFMDGAITHPNAPSTSYPGAPEDITQADINTASAVTSPFTISINSAFNSTFTQVTSTIVVTATGAYAPAAGNIKLRVALVESLHFATAPGITGESDETDFHNVVLSMYPDATGTAMAASWATGDTHTYTITGNILTTTDVSKSPYIVAWIQNDNDKAIAQSAKGNVLSLPAQGADAAIDSSTSQIIACGAAPGTSTVTATIHNYGTAPLTSATIYTKVNTGFTNGTWTPNSWTGNLAPGASTTVTYSVSGVPAYGGSGSNYNRIYDSISAVGDINTGNNTNYGNAFLISAPTNFAPTAASFENTSQFFPGSWTDLNGLLYGTSQLFGIWSTGSTSSKLGHWGSTYAMGEYLAGTDPGLTDYMSTGILTKPASGSTTLDFYYAYAQQSAANNDGLDVVTSSDCGATWTSIWHKSGSDLATAAPQEVTDVNNFAGAFLPTDPSAYKWAAVNLGGVANGSIVAFKLTTDGGNFIFIDDVDIKNAGVSVANVPNAINNVSIYPNPAKESATLNLSLAEATNVQVDVIDAVGRTVANVANQTMAAGVQKINISTAALATGIYNVRITTNAGTNTQRLSVVNN